MLVLWITEIIIISFILISIIMDIHYIINIAKTQKYLKTNIRDFELSRKISMIIVIPVLREQNIICDTIDYFGNMLYDDNLEVKLLIAGTQREKNTLSDFGFKKTTKEVADNHILNRTFCHNFSVFSYEADDLLLGDRATQINFAVDNYLKDGNTFDIVGVFDADSRPTLSTLMEVGYRYSVDNMCSYQQPAFFLDTANRMCKNKENPILVANALYQNTWSIISEIPMWLKYDKGYGESVNNFYCIGHGEFFPYSINKKYRFPEHEVTDGIQIGYRLGMAGEKVAILNNYCNDDVPHDFRTLINQHRRWFGGCMRLREAYDWCCKSNNGKAKKANVFLGLWSQFRWAYTAPIYLVILVASLMISILYGKYIFLYLMFALLIAYCYLLPLISIKITPIESEIKWYHILTLPIAIGVKSLGPNYYIINNITGRKNIYGKVER